ncbi:Cytochrome P450 monooxygenase [Lachnellula occidentalis]|uniref:Cytochrome P450 monooxygenase n=1 Tax=Lachnellula occidentalis TaxID=215460 RepID=A0A8H8UAW1_9HELO|nr:Cytochrome P450 monooxygenase [Lachnellula occidentalis]
MELLTSISICIAFGVLACFLLKETFKPRDQKWRLSGPRYKLPPGPKGTPVFGNLFQFLNARRPGGFVPYLSSMRQHGEMTTLRLGSQTWILLNSKRVAADLINKQGKLTTERPYMPIASGLVSNDKRTVIRQTAGWAEGRRVMHHLLSGSALRVYGDWQESESLPLLLSYLQQPERWYFHNFRYSTTVLYRLVMGGKLDKTKAELDDYQQITMEFVQSIGKSMVDFFPELDRLPAPLKLWRPFWQKMGQHHKLVFQSWWDPIYAAVCNKTAKPSFVRDTLLHPDVKYKGNEEEAMYLATSVIAAGGDNTRMTLNTFIMAMVSNPLVFARARADIDAICCGESTRLPGLADIPRLPYVSAIIKETLRWRPTVPIVPPHQLTEDLQYGPYLFPKGVSFVLNTIAISQEYEEGDSFKPERWLDGNEDNIVHDLWAFGGGRRICVGYKVAQQALFVAITRLIFCFDMSSNGRLDTKNLNHLTVDEPFPIQMKIRSPAHEALILKESAQATKTEAN